eukprot:403335407
MKLVVSVSQDKLRNLPQVNNQKQSLLSFIDDRDSTFFTLQKQGSTKFIEYQNQQRLKNIKQSMFSEQNLGIANKRESVKEKNINTTIMINKLLCNPKQKSKEPNKSQNTTIINKEVPQNSVKNLYYAIQPEQAKLQFDQKKGLSHQSNAIKSQRSVKELKFNFNSVDTSIDCSPIKLPKLGHQRRISYNQQFDSLQTTVVVQTLVQIHGFQNPNENFQKLKDMLKIKHELKANQKQLKQLKNSNSSIIMGDEINNNQAASYESQTMLNSPTISFKKQPQYFYQNQDIIQQKNQSTTLKLKEFTDINDQEYSANQNQGDFTNINRVSDLQNDLPQFETHIGSQTTKNSKQNQINEGVLATIEVCKQVRNNLKKFYMESQSTALKRAEISLEKIRKEKSQVKCSEIDGLKHKFKYNYSNKFFQYVKSGQFINTIRLILKNQDLVNERDGVNYLIQINNFLQFDYTALHWAAKRGFVEVCELLVTFDSDINAKDIFGRTPIEQGNISQNKPIIDFFKKVVNKDFYCDKLKFKDMYQFALLTNPKDLEI